MQDDQHALTILPTGTVVIQVSVLMLFFLCAFSHILQMLWVPTEDINILHTFHSITCIGAEENERNAAHSPGDMQDGESGFYSEDNDGNNYNTNNMSTSNCFSKNAMTSSAHLTPVLLVGIVIFLSNMIFKEHPWIIVLIIQVIIGMAVPIWLIVRHGPLKIHAKKKCRSYKEACEGVVCILCYLTVGCMARHIPQTDHRKLKLRVGIGIYHFHTSKGLHFRLNI